MLEASLKVLKKIEEYGFKSYIVGGFVRDHLLGIESNDVDIASDATPSELRKIFLDACLPHEEYGAVTVIIKNIRFEITTFRKEITYFNNRKPLEFHYIKELKDDLIRRDFLINTIVMNSNGEIIDLLNGKKDLEDRVIHTVGDAYKKFEEDSLRILRAVRFATILQFNLSDEVKSAISETKYLLKNLSYQRKKEELDKIFTCTHVEKGVSLLIELELDTILELPKLKELTVFDDILGVWAQLDVMNIYPFTRIEKEQMERIQAVLPLNNLDNLVLYHYGLYANSVVGNMKGLDKKDITKKYNELPIKTRSDLEINGLIVASTLEKGTGIYLRNIMSDIEEKVVTGKIDNILDDLVGYVKETYYQKS